MAFSISALATGLAGFSANQLQKAKEDKERAREDEKTAYVRSFAENERAYKRQQDAVAEERAGQEFKYRIQGLANQAEQDSLTQKEFLRKYNAMQNFRGLMDAADKDDPETYAKLYTEGVLQHTGNGLMQRRLDYDPATKTFSRVEYGNNGLKLKSIGEPMTYDDGLRFMYGNINPEQTFADRESLRKNAAAKAAELHEWQIKKDYEHNQSLDLEGVRGLNQRANTLLSGQNTLDNTALGWNMKGRYGEQNPTGTGTSAEPTGVPQFSFSQAQPKDYFGLVVGQESGGVHRTANGQLLRSPKGALGATQVMPGTGVDPGYGVKPLQNDSEDEYLRVGLDYLSAMQNEFGDPEKALAAYNAGPKRLQQGMAAAQKSGKPWLSHMPSETQKYVASIKQKYNQRYAKAISQQISSTVAPLTTQILNDFKGVKNELGAEVVNGAQVRGALTNAATLLNKAVAAADPNQKIKFYNDAGTSIALALTGTGLSEQQITDYKNNILTAMVGEGSNFAGVADKVGWRNAPPKQVDPDIEAAINGTGGAKAGKPAAATQATKPPAAQPNIATIVAATTNAPKPHRMQLDAVKKEIGVIQSAIKSGQASPLQQAKLNERLKDLNKALPDSRHISLSDTVGAVTEPFRFKLQTGLTGGAGSVQSNSPAVDNQMNIEARKQLGL